jgi:AcrR family transcriptional regulator
LEDERTKRLPAGAHGIPRDVVERNQRERLIAAMAEVCAERGYAAASVADITRQAGVSTASFYRQFADKRECMLASFAELFERLLEEVERTCKAETEPAAKAQAAIGTAIELLGADLPTARLLTVEVLATGEEGVRLQHEAIERVASRLEIEWAQTAAMFALVARSAIRGEKPSVSDLIESWRR